MNYSREVLEQLIRKNASNIEMSDCTIEGKTKLIEDLEYDSVDLVQLILDIESTFEVNFDMELLVGDKVNVVSELEKIIMEIKLI